MDVRLGPGKHYMQMVAHPFESVDADLREEAGAHADDIHRRFEFRLAGEDDWMILGRPKMPERTGALESDGAAKFLIPEVVHSRHKLTGNPSPRQGWASRFLRFL